MRFVLLYIIRLYWRYIPVHKRRPCIFKVTCSKFVYQQSLEHGLRKGITALFYRLKSCRPGYQLVSTPSGFELILQNGSRIPETEISNDIIKPIEKQMSALILKYKR